VVVIDFGCVLGWIWECWCVSQTGLYKLMSYHITKSNFSGSSEYFPTILTLDYCPLLYFQEEMLNSREGSKALAPHFILSWNPTL